MRAVQYRQIGAGPEVVETETPEPGPGQVLLRISAAGLCHSDLAVMSRPADQFAYGPLPLTLGHEGAGTAIETGPGCRGVELGASYLVYGPWGCGSCRTCATGQENYCESPQAEPNAPGLGSPGALAEYMVVDHPRHLVPLGDLDPVASVSLTDAGLTAFHAVSAALPGLRPGDRVVVLGVGGLGHIAVQLLRALSTAVVIAVDTSPDKLALALSLGAHEVVQTGPDATGQLRAALGARGAGLVLDFVGSPETTTLGAAVVRPQGQMTIVGIAGGSVPVGYRTTAFDVAVRFPYWGSRSELFDVVELARQGVIEVELETFTLDDVPAAYERLASGDITGRAVAIP